MVGVTPNSLSKTLVDVGSTLLRGGRLLSIGRLIPGGRFSSMSNPPHARTHRVSAEVSGGYVYGAIVVLGEMIIACSQDIEAVLVRQRGFPVGSGDVSGPLSTTKSSVPRLISRPTTAITVVKGCTLCARSSPGSPCFTLPHGAKAEQQADPSQRSLAIGRVMATTITALRAGIARQRGCFVTNSLQFGRAKRSHFC